MMYSPIGRRPYVCIRHNHIQHRAIFVFFVVFFAGCPRPPRAAFRLFENRLLTCANAYTIVVLCEAIRLQALQPLKPAKNEKGVTKMRKGSKEVSEAFRAGKRLTIRNTSTDGKGMTLFGNHIARVSGDELSVTLCGWNTPTTRERLNAVFSAFRVNAKVFCKKGQPLIDVEGKIRPISPDEILKFKI